MHLGPSISLTSASGSQGAPHVPIGEEVFWGNIPGETPAFYDDVIWDAGVLEDVIWIANESGPIPANPRNLQIL